MLRKRERQREREFLTQGNERWDGWIEGGREKRGRNFRGRGKWEMGGREGGKRRE